MSIVHAAPTDALLDGRYRLGECVGEGGMARVYRSEDVVLGRTVAIKLIRPGADDASAPERARSEMTVLASLNHPSLVTLFDARLAPRHPQYLVMEFVQGPTLHARMAAGGIPADEVAAIAADLAEGLHIVHTAGIVHRDIKPSNVLLAPAQLPGGRPHAKLADFGIACLGDDTRVTTPGLVVGTAAYIAPEQVRGAEPAPAADVYSLGLVLLEALTGAPAYPPTSSLGSAVARLYGPPAIPLSLGPAWVQLLTRMTNSDPEARPTALDVAVAASELATGPRIAPPLPRVSAAAAAAAAAATPAPIARGPERNATPRPRALPAHAAKPVGAWARAGRRARTQAITASAAAAVVVAAFGAWGVANPAETPAPASVLPAAVVPAPPAADPATDTGAGTIEPVVTPVDVSAGSGVGDEQARQAVDAEKQADEARKQAEEAKKQAEEAEQDLADEQRNQLEEAREKPDNAQKKADEADEKGRDESRKDARGRG